MLKQRFQMFIVATVIGGSLLMGEAAAYAQEPYLVIRGHVNTPDGTPINGITFRGAPSDWLNGVTPACIRAQSIDGPSGNIYRIVINFQDTSACLAQMNAATIDAGRLIGAISAPTGYAFRPR